MRLVVCLATLRCKALPVSGRTVVRLRRDQGHGRQVHEAAVGANILHGEAGRKTGVKENSGRKLTFRLHFADCCHSSDIFAKLGHRHLERCRQQGGKILR